MRSSKSARMNKFDFTTEKIGSVHMTVFEIVDHRNVDNWIQLLQGWQKAGFYSYCPGRRLLPAFTGYYRLLLALSSNPLLRSIIMPNRIIII